MNVIVQVIKLSSFSTCFSLRDGLAYLNRFLLLFQVGLFGGLRGAYYDGTCEPPATLNSIPVCNFEAKSRFEY